MKLHVTFMILLLSSSALAYDFPKFLKTSAGLGVRYESHAIKDLQGRQSDVNSAPIPVFSLSSDVQVSDNMILQPKILFSQVYYDDGEFLKLEESKNHFFSLELNLLSQLSSRCHLEVALAYRDRAYFQENRRFVLGVVTGALELDFGLRYLLFKSGDSTFKTAVKYNLISPQDTADFDVESGEAYSLTFEHMREAWPLLYLKYEISMQDTELFQQNGQALSFGVQYDF